MTTIKGFDHVVLIVRDVERSVAWYRDKLGLEPARLDEAVADNTAMVMNDCALAPDKVVACIGTAATVKDLEARCLAPIDDEGTEGDRLAR